MIVSGMYKYERKMKSKNIRKIEGFEEKEQEKFFNKTFCQVKKINLIS